MPSYVLNLDVANVNVTTRRRVSASASASIFDQSLVLGTKLSNSLTPRNTRQGFEEWNRMQ